MKLTKKQNLIISIIFVMVVVIGTVSITVFGKNIKDSYALGLSVNSASVTNGSDIVSIRATSSSSPIVGYYIGTSNSLGNATYYPASNASGLSVSLLNGTYYVWVRDSSGNTAKYNKTVSVTNSCSSFYIKDAKGSGTAKHCYYTSDGRYLEETMSESLVTCANGYVRDESKTSVVSDTCSSLSAGQISSMGLSKKVCSKVWSYACVSTGGTTNNTLGIESVTTSNDWTNNSKEITVTARKGSSNIAGYYISTSSSKPSTSANWNASSSTTWKTTQPAGTYYVWVKDAAGNISNDYKSVTVSKIDSTAPHINSIVPSSVNKSLTISASDEGGSGIAGYYISTNNTAPNLGSSWIDSTESSYTSSQNPATYYVWVKDAAGNISGSKVAKIAESSTTDNNSLASLSIKDIEISPEFKSSVLEYTATSTVSKIVLDATLEDSNASFVKNYGPRSINLKTGENKVLIKVKSATGNVKEYKITVTYNGKTSSKVSARLKSLKLNSGNLTFDPDITEYRMYVPKSLEQLEIKAESEDKNAEIAIEGPEELQIGDNQIEITVTATDGTSKKYNLKIIKKETEEISTNNYLKSLTITNYKIDFDRNDQEYAIALGRKTSLDIKAIAEDRNAEVTIDNTKYLTKDSIVNVIVRAEDGSARVYRITLNKSELTVWHIILIVIGSIFVLLLAAYVILRLMGYSIYINLGVIKDFFARLFKRKG